jgi:hypothetical protein
MAKLIGAFLIVLIECTAINSVIKKEVINVETREKATSYQSSCQTSQEAGEVQEGQRGWLRGTPQQQPPNDEGRVDHYKRPLAP